MESSKNVAAASTRDNSELLPEIDFIEDVPEEHDVILRLDNWLDFLASHGVLS
jgi:hypothetical protein